MKKQLLFFFFLCSLSFANAQTSVYHPFPSDSVVWLQERAQGFASFAFFIDEMMGDTTIGATAYKKLYRSELWSTTPYTPSTPLYSPTLPVNYWGALRQDIPNKKVYLVGAGNSTEHLMFDFDLQLGDTISTAGDTIIVSSIDSVLVGGFYHKVFALSNSWCEGINHICIGSLIEGVGYTEGLEQAYIDMFSGWGQQLLCFSHKNISLYPATGVSCALTLGISELSDNKITFSAMPNPSPGVVSLSVGCKDNYFVEVKNSTGQTVFFGSNTMLADSVIDLSAYSPGIYFIRISDSKGNSATKKIIKQ